VLVVTERKENKILGQLVVPLRELLDRQSDDVVDSDQPSSSPRRAPLEPHKNCSLPTGEVVFDTWLSVSGSTRSARPQSLSVFDDERIQSSVEYIKYGGSLNKLREQIRRTLSLSDMKTVAGSAPAASTSTADGNSMGSHRRVLSSSSLSRCVSSNESLITLKNSRNTSPFSSAADVDHFFAIDSLSLQQADVMPCVGELSIGDGDVSPVDCNVLHRRDGAVWLSVGRGNDDSETGYQKRWSLENTANNGNAMAMGRPPTISSVSPAHGPTEGGTTIVIVGRDLGLGLDDVVALSVCGCDVLASLEYSSPEKLVVTTKTWRACVGHVVVETASGGRTSGSASFAAQFTFADDEFDIPLASRVNDVQSSLTVKSDIPLDFVFDVDAMYQTGSAKPIVQRTGSERTGKSKDGNNNTPNVSEQQRRHSISVLSAGAIISGFRDVGRRLKSIDRKWSLPPVLNYSRRKSDGVIQANVGASLYSTIGNESISRRDADSLSRVDTRDAPQQQQQQLQSRPPIGEIQPRRKEVQNNAINRQLDEAPPKKPPRTKVDLHH